MPVLLVSFIAQQLIIVPKCYSAYLFLSGYGMKSGHLWELFTCQFFQSNHTLLTGSLHLVINLAGLWFVARPVEAHLGSGRFLLLFFGSGLAGSLAQGGVAVTGFYLPESLGTAADFLIARFGESVGSSNGLCGVLALFCVWKRDATVHLLWLFPVKAGRLLWLALGGLALLLVVPSDPTLAHVGHFVGLLTGLAFCSLWPQSAAGQTAGVSK
jgi:membrane associated rhomboid family serine protease